MRFNYMEFITKDIFDSICEIKINTPKIVESEALLRKRRKNITKDGKLQLIIMQE